MHLVTVALPHIPPAHKSFSIPSYVLVHVALALLLIAWARPAPGLAAWWRERVSAPLRVRIAGLIGLACAGALAVRSWTPTIYSRLSREEGLFEPVTVLCYAGGAILLWRVSRAGASGRPLRFAALCLAFFALEEVDWFSVFGGVIGRIDGVYAGSVHDVIRLAAEGVMGPSGLAIFGAIVATVFTVAWRAGYLDPRWLVREALAWRALWAVAAIAFLFAAAAEEAHLFGWIASQPTPEEAVEMVAALCLAVWALETAAAAPEAGAAT